MLTLFICKALVAQVVKPSVFWNIFTRLDQVEYQGEFPKGWKFIWFDVPTSQDLLDSDLGIPELEDSIYSNLVENNVDLHDLYNMLTNENDNQC